MSGLPAPKPALRRTEDGAIAPAMVYLSTLTIDLALDDLEHRKPKKKDQDIVELPIELPKRTRKRLRKKAATYDWTAEEAAGQLIRAWLDRT